MIGSERSACGCEFAFFNHMPFLSLDVCLVGVGGGTKSKVRIAMNWSAVQKMLKKLELLFKALFGGNKGFFAFPLCTTLDSGKTYRTAFWFFVLAVDRHMSPLLTSAWAAESF